MYIKYKVFPKYYADVLCTGPSAVILKDLGKYIMKIY